jgi:hypothetical protein
MCVLYKYNAASRQCNIGPIKPTITFKSAGNVNNFETEFNFLSFFKTKQRDINSTCVFLKLFYRQRREVGVSPNNL